MHSPSYHLIHRRHLGSRHNRTHQVAATGPSFHLSATLASHTQDALGTKGRLRWCPTCKLSQSIDLDDALRSISRPSDGTGLVGSVWRAWWILSIASLLLGSDLSVAGTELKASAIDGIGLRAHHGHRTHHKRSAQAGL